MIGLPVITTRNGGQASYVSDGEDGYFVNCGDVNGLIEKLGTVLGSYDKAKKMGDHGKKKYRELFSAKHTVESFMNIFHRTFS